MTTHSENEGSASSLTTTVKRLKVQKYDGTVVDGTIIMEKGGGYRIAPDDGTPSFFIPASRVIEHLPATRQ